MSAGIWLYNEKICEGHECIKDCDKCSYAEKIFELEEQEYQEDEQEQKLNKWLNKIGGKND